VTRRQSKHYSNREVGHSNGKGSCWDRTLHCTCIVLIVSHAGGSLSAGRATHAGQFLSKSSHKERYPSSRLGVGADNRISMKRNSREEPLSYAGWFRNQRRSGQIANLAVVSENWRWYVVAQLFEAALQARRSRVRFRLEQKWAPVIFFERYMPVRGTDYLATFMCRLSDNTGSLNLEPSGRVQG
jgi:hypothetical protein